jgi:hypothetical protein
MEINGGSMQEVFSFVDSCFLAVRESWSESIYKNAIKECAKRKWYFYLPWLKQVVMSLSLQEWYVYQSLESFLCLPFS